MKLPKIHLHQGDLPDVVEFTGSVAVDTEAMGLMPHRDRLCLVQLSDSDGLCHRTQQCFFASQPADGANARSAQWHNQPPQRHVHT